MSKEEGFSSSFFPPFHREVLAGNVKWLSNRLAGTVRREGAFPSIRGLLTACGLNDVPISRLGSKIVFLFFFFLDNQARSPCRHSGA